MAAIPADGIKCIICWEAPRDAVECIDCGQLLCDPCAVQHLNSERGVARCPHCRHEPFEFAKSLVARRMVAEIRDRCSYCTKIFLLSELERHMLTCNVSRAPVIKCARSVKEFKILLIGDANTGKTALIERFRTNRFTETPSATIGPDFKTRYLKINGNLLQLQMWDTAGQERSSLVPLLFRNTDGIMLVYDITDRVSFERLRYWRVQVNNFAPPSVALVQLGNKADKSADRKVTKEEGASATENVPFIETSAKTGENVERAFRRLAVEVLKKMQHQQGYTDGPTSIILGSLLVPKKTDSPDESGAAAINSNRGGTASSITLPSSGAAQKCRC